MLMSGHLFLLSRNSLIPQLIVQFRTLRKEILALLLLKLIVKFILRVVVKRNHCINCWLMELFILVEFQEW